MEHSQEWEDKVDFEKFLSGEAGGFERLVLRYKNPLIFFIKRYVTAFDLAEEIAQDTFADFYEFANRYNGKASIKTYLFTIGKNKAITYLRKNGRISYLEEEYEIQAELDLERAIVAEEEKTYLIKALGRMNKDYSRVLLLVIYENMSYKEVAAVMKKTMPQIKILVHRAKKALKKQLESEGFVYEK